MATQLRLVEALPEQHRTAKAPASRRSRPTKAVVRSARGTSSRRAAHWGDWHLDAKTRRIGREGVAAAREALETAGEALSQAS